MTIISLRNSADCILVHINLKDEDATGEAIANAVIELVQQTGSLNAGDKITVEEV